MDNIVSHSLSSAGMCFFLLLKTYIFVLKINFLEQLITEAYLMFSTPIELHISYDFFSLFAEEQLKPY